VSHEYSVKLFLECNCIRTEEGSDNMEDITRALRIIVLRRENVKENTRVTIPSPTETAIGLYFDYDNTRIHRDQPNYRRNPLQAGNNSSRASTSAVERSPLK
jgi:hypothetical protein